MEGEGYLRIGYIKYKDNNNKTKTFISTNLDKYVDKLIEVPDDRIVDYKFGKNTLSFDDKNDKPV